MIPTGKGIFIWPLTADELISPTATAVQLAQAGFSHAILRIADGIYSDGIVGSRDLVAEYSDALREVGIQVWGFAAVYGAYPDQEAAMDIRRMLELGLNGLLVDAEGAYKHRGAAAIKYMGLLRTRLSGVPIGLSSFRWPSLHAEFPWKEFMSRVDFAMPQVYWAGASNAEAQLYRCLEEYHQRWPDHLVIPTGAAFQEHGWRAKPAEIIEFFTACQAVHLPGCNFWEYGHSIRYDLWDTLKILDWDGDIVIPDPDPETGTTAMIANTRSDRVNLRSQATVSTETVMGQLFNGVQVEVLERIPDGEDVWLRVRVEGLVAKKYRGQTLVRE